MRGRPLSGRPLSGRPLSGRGLGQPARRAGGGGARAFDPLSLAPFAWYDPSDLSTLFQDDEMTVPVTAPDDPVGAMLDKSGNGNHVIQATEANRPLYKASGGLHWLEFDGSNDFLSDAFVLAQPIDVVHALRRISAATNVNLIGGPSAGAVTWVNGSGDLLLGSGANFVIASPAPANGTDFVVSARFNGASSRGAVDNGSYTTGDAGGSAASGMQIAASEGGAVSAIRFYGLVQKSAFTDSEIAALRTYLAAKQGRVL